ncbi:YidH family protein [Oceaniovalibus sp. ACAM 378]|jgi:putative membrane protein|uniref:YidH family protein n=1 Tax=Oceaniovalibus sp. ACAM 378 TaxID=2599923 RepID=UPI002103E579|nr:DUF202 domain-containing protein [Oceaniovalibus sp. ACAM 378]
MMDTKTKWAEDRTDWAEDRTILANERTFAGWIRTGMACVAIAMGLSALIGESDLWFHPGRIVSSLFCGVAILIFWTARKKCLETVARLNDHAAKPLPTAMVTLLSTLMTLGAAGVAALLWVIP